jgi:hypothetical protein
MLILSKGYASNTRAVGIRMKMKIMKKKREREEAQESVGTKAVEEANREAQSLAMDRAVADMKMKWSIRMALKISENMDHSMSIAHHQANLSRKAQLKTR